MKIIKKTGVEEEDDGVYEELGIDWPKYMVLARQMGMSEEEFWKSCPIFFLECSKEYSELERRKGGINIG